MITISVNYPVDMLLYEMAYIYKSTIAFAAKLLDRMICNFLCVIYQLCFQILEQRLRFYHEILFLCKYVIADMHNVFSKSGDTYNKCKWNSTFFILKEYEMICTRNFSFNIVVAIFYQYIFQSCDIGIPKHTYHILYLVQT